MNWQKLDSKSLEKLKQKNVPYLYCMINCYGYDYYDVITWVDNDEWSAIAYDYSDKEMLYKFDYFCQIDQPERLSEKTSLQEDAIV